LKSLSTTARRLPSPEALDLKEWGLDVMFTGEKGSLAADLSPSPLGEGIGNAGR